MFKTYILESEIDGTYYIGFSSNLAERLKKHNEGRSRYTKSKRPWKVVYFESFDIKSDAIKREKFLKCQKNREFYKKLIDNWSGSSVG